MLRQLHVRPPGPDYHPQAPFKKIRRQHLSGVNGRSDTPGSTVPRRGSKRGRLSSAAGQRQAEEQERPVGQDAGPVPAAEQIRDLAPHVGKWVALRRGVVVAADEDVAALLARVTNDDYDDLLRVVDGLHRGSHALP